MDHLDRLEDEEFNVLKKQVEYLGRWTIDIVYGDQSYYGQNEKSILAQQVK